MKQRVFRVFKYTLYALLIANIFLFLNEASPNKAIDEIGWLLLLGVFEWETRALGMAQGYRLGWPLAIEISGYALALFAWVTYGRTREWLDFGNASVWLLISAMIILDLLHPIDAGTRAFRFRTAAKATLYAATFGFALAWGVEGVWLDFWDALLWILSFFIIEINIFRFEMDHRPKAR